MSASSTRYETSRRRQVYGASAGRSTLGHWVPLAVTVTVATVGLVAWIWKERSENEELEYDRKGGGGPPAPGYGDSGSSAQQQRYARGPEGQPLEDASVLARMSGALRRTPSPQQIFDGASRRVAAGVAAAGAVVGGALSSIREEDKRDFEDHSRWSEEAQARSAGTTTTGQTGPAARGPVTAGSSTCQPGLRTGEKRKAVAIVISAETKHHHDGEDEPTYFQEHAVSLSPSVWLCNIRS
jgi:hypothetical protein